MSIPESTPQGYTVGAVAKLAGVTVRTLHHYDEVGLLVPGARSRSGYRRYSETDLDRLRRILAYRELGFGLDDIADLLDGGDTTAHLLRQHELLADRIGRLRHMLAAVELELEANTMGLNLSQEEKFELFGDFDPDEHDEEARRRWGDTDAYRESQRRARSYDKQDWQRIAQEQAELHRDFGRALADGADPTGERTMSLAERHRQLISRWFYDCDYEMQCGLAEMYVNDSRFTDVYEREVGAGGAEFVRDAILANASRH